LVSNSVFRFQLKLKIFFSDTLKKNWLTRRIFPLVQRRNLHFYCGIAIKLLYISNVSGEKRRFGPQEKVQNNSVIVALAVAGGPELS
jgi:hypothetical protein